MENKCETLSSPNVESNENNEKLWAHQTLSQMSKNENLWAHHTLNTMREFDKLWAHMTTVNNN